MWRSATGARVRSFGMLARRTSHRGPIAYDSFTVPNDGVWMESCMVWMVSLVPKRVLDCVRDLRGKGV